MPTNLVSNDRTSPYWEAGALWHNPMYDDLQVSINNIAKAVNTGVSTVYKCRLTRIDGTATEYASEVYLEFVDCHYQKDTLGSRIERLK